jgi:hypothetical protein
LKHFTTPAFWECYERLPSSIRKLASKKFEILKQDSSHPSLHFKKIGRFRSVRVGLRYRALGVAVPEGVLWFWIGTHAEYDDLIR